MRDVIRHFVPQCWDSSKLGNTKLSVEYVTVYYVCPFVPMLQVVLAVFCLPFVIMRAAMMELDCFIAHKKELDAMEAQQIGKNRRQLRASRQAKSLLETVLRNSESKSLKARMYLSMCCGVCGMMIFTMFTMMAGAFIFFSLH